VDSPSHDRRAVCRYILEDEFEAIFPLESITIRLRDLSERGIRFTCDRQIPLYSAIVINFDLYPVNFALRALVVWCREEEKDRYIHGAEFVNLQDEEELLLVDFVKTLNANPAPD